MRSRKNEVKAASFLENDSEKKNTWAVSVGMQSSETRPGIKLGDPRTIQLEFNKPNKQNVLSD